MVLREVSRNYPVLRNRKKSERDRAGMELRNPWNSIKRVNTSVMVTLEQPYKSEKSAFM